LHGWKRAVPAFDAKRLVDVVIDYGATPDWVDASDDDGPAIQRALTDVADPQSRHFGAVVFVPHGTFHVRAPLRLHNGPALIGSSMPGSIIHAAVPNERLAGPILSIEGWKSGAIVSDLGLYTWIRYGYLDVTAPGVLVRDLLTEMDATVPKYTRWQPSFKVGSPVSFSGRASGDFYGLSLDHIAADRNSDPAKLLPLVLIDGTKSPLHFYQLSVEHMLGPHAQFLIKQSADVHVHACKYETGVAANGKYKGVYSGSFASIRDSHNISVFGGSGNYEIARPEDKGIFEISGSSNTDFAGLVRKRLPNLKDLPGKALVVDLDSGAAISDNRAVLYYSIPGGVVV